MISVDELTFVMMGCRLGRDGNEGLLRKLARTLPGPRYRKLFLDELARREVLDA
jgi:hypothetical protein